MNKNLVAITDCDHDDIEVESKALAKEGLEAVWLACKTEEDLIRECKGFKSLIIEMYIIDASNVDKEAE